MKSNRRQATPIEEMEKLVKKFKAEGKTIVTTNGCFDILHPGHAKILSEAKEQGDVLIVGIDSDESVRGNKGENRPVFNENERAEMLLSFEYVDYVVIYPELDCIRFVDTIKPHVHVNDSDYGTNCVEAETVRKTGGTLHIIKKLKGYSSTEIMERIRSGYRKI